MTTYRLTLYLYSVTYFLFTCVSMVDCIDADIKCVATHVLKYHLRFSFEKFNIFPCTKGVLTKCSIMILKAADVSFSLYVSQPEVKSYNSKYTPKSEKTASTDFIFTVLLEYCGHFDSWLQTDPFC